MSVPTLYGFPSPEGGSDAGGYDYHYYDDEDEDYDHVATDDYKDRVCTN